MHFDVIYIKKNRTELWRFLCYSKYLRSIYIVDSSDNLFDEDVEKACKRHHFNQADHTSCTSGSTTLELLSFDQALSVFGQEWETTYDYIIKLTCKYTLPDLEKQCNLVKNKDNMLILQNRGN